MLFVDDPAVFQKDLPGFLPQTFGQGTGSDPFHGTLCEALFGDGYQPLMTTQKPTCVVSDFWTFWYLAARSSVSQYDTLRRVISDRQDLPGHGVCLALSGRQFHGQQGRPWQAVSGNLHLSLALRCDLSAADCGLALTMLPAVAVMDALSHLTMAVPGSGQLGIKWVNDILIGSRKVGGVLTSARSQEGRLGSCVLGIGLNVGVAPEVEPTPFTPGITCLKDHFLLPEKALESVLFAVLDAVALRYTQLADEGPGPLLAAYRSASVVLGRMVEIRSERDSSPCRKGRVLAIGSNLALTLDDRPQPVTSGRLVLFPEDD